MGRGGERERERERERELSLCTHRDSILFIKHNYVIVSINYPMTKISDASSFHDHTTKLREGERIN